MGALTFGEILLEGSLGFFESGEPAIAVDEIVGELVAPPVLSNARSSSASVCAASSRILWTSLSIWSPVRLTQLDAFASTLVESSATSPTLTSPALAHSRSA